MSAGLLPVSLGQALMLLVQAAFRRLRGAALVVVPLDETGYQHPAPEDFAVLDTIVALALLVGFCGFVWCVGKLLDQRAEARAAETAEPARKPEATLPSLNHLFWSNGDVVRWVRRRDPHLTPAGAMAFAESATMDSERPTWGVDWSEWLEANHDRLLDRTIASLETEADYARGGLS
jgi:hypothetical protein